MPAASGDVSEKTITFRIFGRAHPERQGWWFDSTIVERAFGDGTRLRLEGEMRAGHFHARLDLRAENLPRIDPRDAKNELEEFVRTRLDVLGLVHGAAVDCEVVQLELPNGEVTVLTTAFGGLEVEEAKNWFRRLSLIAELVAGVRLGLADFRQAIRTPIDTALFTYRGLDGVRADIATREGIQTEARSWERMRDITGLDRESDIDPVKVLADQRRHGNDTSISAEQRRHALAVLQRALLAYAEWCASELPPVRDAVVRVLATEEQVNSGVGGDPVDP